MKSYKSMRTIIINAIGYLFILFNILSCQKEELATLITTEITNLTTSTATCGGEITSDGGGKIAERGICWGQSPSPTILSQKNSEGKGNSPFTSIMTGLLTNTSYYVRAYATNDAGTAYGNEITFTLFLNTPGPSVADIDGNTYNSVKIGNQIWMTGNLSTTKFNDNTNIPLVTNGMKWQDLTTPAYCFYEDNLWYKEYGALYNWYTVNTGKLCPTGWHVPTNAEWNTLYKYLGGTSVAGGKLKEAGTTHWSDPNTGATNESGFTAVPCGLRSGNQFHNFREQGFWWSLDQMDQFFVIVQDFNYRSTNIDANHSYLKDYGFSVRCLENN
jgi:uncharacterized protein (TIGR02145 family)